MIGAQAGVTKSLGNGAWLLSPAVPIEKAKDHIGWVHRLGKLYARVKALEERASGRRKQAEKRGGKGAAMVNMEIIKSHVLLEPSLFSLSYHR